MLRQRRFSAAGCRQFSEASTTLGSIRTMLLDGSELLATLEAEDVEVPSSTGGGRCIGPVPR